MRRMRTLNIGAGLLAAAWYSLIWNFSAQPATQSGQMSDGLLHRLLLMLAPSYGEAVRDVQITAMEILSFYERKAAHMFLYFVLALLIWLGLLGLVRGVKAHCGLNLVLCALLAAIDEYHQTLVPGRSGELRDVLVDLGGAAIATFGLVWILRGVRFRRTGRMRWQGFLLFPLGFVVLLVFVFWKDIGLLPPFAFRMMNGGVERFQGLSVEEKQELLHLASPVLRETLGLAACGLTGCCVAGGLLCSGVRKVVVPAAILAVVPCALIAWIGGVNVVLAAAFSLLGTVILFFAWWLCDCLNRWSARSGVQII